MRKEGWSEGAIRGQIDKWDSATPKQSDKSPSSQVADYQKKAAKLATGQPPQDVPLPYEGPTHVQPLQQYGVQQDITKTNQDVQAIVDAHQQKLGYQPSAGLVFDLLRAKPILGGNPDWNHIFGSVPASQRDAQTTNVTSADAPYKFHPDNTYVRKDGLLVKAVSSQPWVPPPTTLTDLHKEYPTVQMGMLPLPNAEGIYSAIDQLAGNNDNLKVSDMGQSFDQARKLGEEATGSVVKGYEMAYHSRSLVKTLVGAQENLNEMMGTKLPVTGFMTPEWQKALANWMKSKDYFTRTAQFQAKQAGYHNYGGYLKAFQTKQKLVKENPALAQFLNALPLHSFDQGDSAAAVIKGAEESPFMNPHFDISYPLHALTRSAGLALDVVGGTVNQAKADAAAGTAFYTAVIPKWAVLGGGADDQGNFDAAMKKARAALVANPNWVRVFMPGLPEKDYEKGISQLVNFTGDLLLLRKPVFTGEAVKAGNVEAALRSAYVPRVSRYAHGYLKDGHIGRAAALLEGGAGSERLAAAAAPAIKRGRMTAEQFQQHVAELYANGRTTIITLPKEKEGVIDVFHGTDTTAPLDAAKGDAGNRFGHSIFVTPEGNYASSYAEVKRAARESMGQTGELPEGVAPNVRLHRVDATRLFPYRVEAEVDTPKLIKRVLKKLTPEEQATAKNLETMKLENVKDPKTLYDYLATLGSRLENNSRSEFAAEAKAAGEHAIPETGTYGRDFANEVLQRAGFTGVHDGREIAVFDAEKTLLPRFEKPIEVTVTGPTLDSLRTKHLVTPGRLSLAARTTVRDAVDDFDKGLRESAVPGTTSAADFTSWLRSKFAHAAPRSPRAYYDPKLPERLHDFVLAHFGNAELANKYESELVRARAAGNTPRIQKIEGQIQSRYYRKYNLGPGSPIEEDPFSPLLESEAGSRFHFPAGNRQPIKDPFDAIAETAAGINYRMNKVAGGFRRLLIISPSLTWKHAIGDTLRRIIGGDSDVFGTGLKESRADITRLVDGNPELARRWGAFLDRTTNSEVYYMAQPGEKSKSFTTSEQFGNKGYMRGAGRSLRQMLDDHALAAYRASTPEDMQPLVDMIKSNPVYRRLWSAAQRARAEALYGKETVKAGKRTIGEIDQTTMQRVVRTQTRKEMLSGVLTAEDYANSIYNRYKRVEEAAQAQDTSLEDARTVLRNHRGGHADDALGQWIADNGVDFHIDSALVVPSHNLDSISSGIVKKVMAPNKWNRAMMAKSIAAGAYRDLKAAGWRDEDALHTAISVAEKQTIYHMLDFSNMLQAEQDLRWVVFFATKHRLYWKWVASTLVRNPAVSALVEDVKQNLDTKGNFNFTLFGHKLAIPAARLVWVPGKEFPETSPFFGGVSEFLKSGFSVQAGANGLAGSQLTGLQRNVVPAMMLVRFARMEAGNLPATYNAAASGLDPTNARYLRRAINHFQMDYFREHGHYAPEAEAVKHALWRQAAEGMWRSNLPLPVIPQTPNDSQKLLAQYMLLNDPAKRSKFLDDHPELALSFGVSTNPRDYTHLRSYWSRFTQLMDQRTAIREHIYQTALRTGHMTSDLEELRHKADAEFSKMLNALKKEDLNATDLSRTKEINGERLGLWGQQLATDPLTDPTKALKDLFPNLKQSELAKGVPGQMVKDAQRELDLLNDPAWVAKTFTDPAEARTRKRELLTFIQDFRNPPKDPLGKLENKYLTEHVNPYWKHVENFNAQIAKMGRGDKDTAYAKLRAWKDAQDKPVTINGVTFPSPIAAAWQTLPPDLFRQRVAALATGSWDHLADYEKKLLGYTPSPGTSQGWETYTESIRSYHQQYPGHNLAANQLDYLVKAIDKQNPGFAKDYKFSKLAGIQRLEQLAPYKEMPQKVKVLWDAEIKPNADVIAKAYASKGYKTAELRQTWENYVKTDIIPFVDSHPALKKWLSPYLTANPDFLNTLPVN